MQGLLSAMGASVRAKSRQAAGTQSLLSSRAKRERNIAALQDAAIAIDAAHALANGIQFFLETWTHLSHLLYTSS